MVDMGDLKSPGPKGPCGFESHLRYNFNDAPVAQMDRATDFLQSHSLERMVDYGTGI